MSGSAWRRVLTLVTVTMATFAVAPAARARVLHEPHLRPGVTWEPSRFADPRSDSRPSILWFWNGTVTPALVDRQLADMRAQGIRQALVFPFDTTALQPAFGTDAWFDLIGHTLREAQAHGMRLWLFNDDFFPSGRGAMKVVQDHPELRPKGVNRSTTTVAGGAPVDVRGLLDRGLAVRDGRLIVDAAARSGVTLLRTGVDWGDTDVSATVRVHRGTAGLIVRAPDRQNGYLVDLRDDGGVNVWRQVDGAFTLLRLGDAPAGFDRSADHELRVQLRGDAIAPFLDGRALPIVHDGTFARGRVGVRAVSDQLSSWDSLRVTDASGAPLFASGFDDSGALDAFDLPDPLEHLAAVAARPQGSADASDVIDLTAKARAGERWDAPPGDWRVDVFSWSPLADDNPASFRRGYIDTLDEEAVRRFLDAVAGEYQRRFPWAFGTVLRGFADDEPFIPSADAHFQAVPWTGELPKAIEHAGASPAAALSSVFDDLGRSGSQARGAFWRAVSDRFADAYMRTEHDWMAEHGVGFISNPLWDEYGPAEQIKSTGDLNAVNEWAQVPGTDVVFDHFLRGYQRTLPRWAASASHQLGLHRTYLEAMGAFGWQVTPGDTREVIGSFAARGVNFTMLHAAWTDQRNVFYAPPFDASNTWWSASAPLYTWIGRVMELGRAPTAARTALLQPQRAAEQAQDTPDADAIDAGFTRAVHDLEDHQVDFDLLDAGALTGDPALRVHARVRHGVLRVGEQSYRVVVVPHTPALSVGAARRLARFARAGGTVIMAGEPPARETGGDDAALRAALAQTHAVRTEDAGAAAAEAGAAAARLTPATPQVRVLRLRGGAFLLVNEGAATDVTATFPVSGVPTLWDPETGRATPATTYRAERGGTAVPLHLGPYAALGVSLAGAPPGHVAPHALAVDAPTTAAPGPGGQLTTITREGHGLRATVDAGGPGTVTVAAADRHRLFRGTASVRDPLTPIALGGEWTVRLDRDGAQSRQRPLGSWTVIDPAWSGSATYERSFDLDAGTLAGRQFTLDLGDVRDVAQVTVNGHELPPRLWAPYALDVTHALRPGRNTISVRVTNTLANVHGDARASGLLGPVTLRPSRRVTVELRPLHHGERLLQVELDDPPTGIAPGQRLPVTATVRDLTRRPGTVSLSASTTGALTALPAESDVQLGRDGVGRTTLTLSAPGEAQPGAATLLLRVGDASRSVPVRIDWATRLGRASASSTTAPFAPERAIDGDVDSTHWDGGGGWNDGTIDAWPDTLTVAFAAPAPVGEVTVHTLDSAQYPASSFGISDYDVQVETGGEWRTVGEVRGSERGVEQVTFDTVEATGVRIVVKAARQRYSRIVEVEARPGG